MSKRNGDRARFNRQRRKKMIRRERASEAKQTIVVVATAPAPESET